MKFKIGDKVRYKKEYISEKPDELPADHVYTIQDISINDILGIIVRYYLLPKNNHLKIIGNTYNNSTWSANEDELELAENGLEVISKEERDDEISIYTEKIPKNETDRTAEILEKLDKIISLLENNDKKKL